MSEPTTFTEANILIAILNDEDGHAKELIEEMMGYEKVSLMRALLRAEDLVRESLGYITW